MTRPSCFCKPHSFRTLLILCGVLSALLVGVRQAIDAPAHSGATPFPRELVAFTPDAGNPLFTSAGPGHWDAKIRERGWVMQEADGWHLWYTGYDGTREGIRQLGYATSPDGLAWNRYSDQPLLPGVWVEDMCVVRQGDTYYMFAEGEEDHTHLLTSTDRVHWQTHGTLDVRTAAGEPLSAGPFGTPTVWHEDGTWYLFYERMDAAIWLATSRDLKVWTNLSDEPVLLRGPTEHDSVMIALNQIIKHEGWYYATYHGTGGSGARRIWNTNLARSSDLLHWQKYPGNPIVRDKSSGQFQQVGQRWRLYTTHDTVDLFHSSAP